MINRDLHLRKAALVALAGQTRGAIGLSLNFFGYPAYRQAGFFFKKKSDKIKLKTLFLTLRVFSATGGIEKVCRIMGKALYEESLENETQLQIASMYDKQTDAWQNRYFPTEIFTGYGVNKLQFINGMVSTGAGSDTVILSHINLLPITWFIKKASPKTRIILLAHGIEIWYPLSRTKRKLLNKCDLILAVSRYTKNKIIAVHGVKEEKCEVLNNCLNPFLPLPSLNKKSENLLKKYGFNESNKILMTLTRLSSKERYKGYDKVIESVATLNAKFPGIKYLIAGFYDSEEKAFVDRLIASLGLQNTVIMPGFIDDEELQDHFAMSDVYVMPSREEGFGIVFIEAMYYGLPVIAGNIDGSVDALLDGKLGQLVNPSDIDEIAKAIKNVLENKTAFNPDRELLLENFSYEAYKRKLQQAMANIFQGSKPLQPQNEHKANMQELNEVNVISDRQSFHNG